MPAGRPTAYDPKYCDEILEYFSIKPYEKTDGKTEVADLPTFAGFAKTIGVHRDTLNEWTNEHPQFSDAYKKAKEIQEDFLVINGLRSNINTAFGIFVLKNCHNWKEKQPGEEDRKITHDGGVTVTKLDLDDRLKQLKGEE